MMLETGRDVFESYCPVCGDDLVIVETSGIPFVQCASGGKTHIVQSISMDAAREFEDLIEGREIAVGVWEEARAEEVQT